jgi:hypothetical protein
MATKELSKIGALKYKESALRSSISSGANDVRLLNQLLKHSILNKDDSPSFTYQQQ